MPSNIDVSGIDTTSPVVGTKMSASDERNSRVAIKDGLQTAANEITALQNDVANISGGASYTHNQTTASDTWIINHNLGRYPSITPLSVGGVEFSATVIHISINQAQLLANVAVAGIAQCN